MVDCLGGQGNAVATGTAGATGKAREGIASFEFVDEVLIRKSELESKKALIGDLSGRVEELTLNNEHQLRLKEMDHSDKVTSLSRIKMSVMLNKTYCIVK